jgi:hypothetical protein
MFNNSEKSKASKNDAETRSAELIAALSIEERLTQLFQKAVSSAGTRDVGSPSVEDLLRNLEEARRNSGDALERWRQAVRQDTTL